MRKWKSSKLARVNVFTHYLRVEDVWIFFVCVIKICFVFRIGVSVKQQFTEEEIYKDRDSQISAIEKTFEDAQKSVSEHVTRLPKSLLLNILYISGNLRVKWHGSLNTL